MKKIIFVSLGLISLLFGASQVRASELALDFTGTLQNAFLAELTFGWSFTANEAIFVDGLGFFDDEIVDGAGLQQDHRVSLWNSSGVLLASTTITNASTPVASTAENGRWLFNDITPILLNQGEYIIGAFDPVCSGANCDRIRFLDTATTSPLITFIEALDASGSGIPEPLPSSRNDGYFGPNLSVSAVPLPAAVWLFGTAILALTGFGRRRKAASL